VRRRPPVAEIRTLYEPGLDASPAPSGRRDRGIPSPIGTSPPRRAGVVRRLLPIDARGCYASENHQVAHLEPLLRRREPTHPYRSTFPGPRRPDVLDGRSQRLDLDARTGHVCIIRIRPPCGIVPRSNRTRPRRTPTRIEDPPPGLAGARSAGFVGRRARAAPSIPGSCSSTDRAPWCAVCRRLVLSLSQPFRRPRRVAGHRCRPSADGSGRRRGGSWVQINANISGSMVASCSSGSSWCLCLSLPTISQSGAGVQHLFAPH
jgi:hypothetical protein